MFGITHLRALKYYLKSAADIKTIYWDISRLNDKKKQLKVPANSAFALRVNTERKLVPETLQADSNQDIDVHLNAAVDWVLLAQKSSGDNGVALGYFPLEVGGGWKPSYPETTGYIITSLLNYAHQNTNAEVKAAAIAMADWEIDVQMSDGAVQGGPVCEPEKQTAAAFNTGMVLDGWCSAYETTKADTHKRAMRRAAEWLANDLDKDGYYQTNGDFVSQGEIKTYTCLCAWAIYRAGVLLERQDIKDAAIRSIEAALKQQKPNGWFAHNCLTHSDTPLTHTIGYTLQGVLEVGVLSKNEAYINAVIKALKGIAPQQRDNGYLAARFDKNWQPASTYVCLTGSAQIAIVCYRLAKEFGNREFIEFANKLTNFVKATQAIATDNPAIKGAIAGSYPIMGGYMNAGYPNWATKYFIDALMLQKETG